MQPNDIATLRAAIAKAASSADGVKTRASESGGEAGDAGTEAEIYHFDRDAGVM